METWDAIRARRDVRSFEPRPIPPGDLDRVLEAGWRAPSSSNQQRWDFVVCTDRTQLEELSKVWRGAGHVATSAATVVLVAPDAQDVRERESISYDLGQATLSMMLAATELGIGSGHAAVSDQDLARKLLGFPADRYPAFMIPLGYPAEGPLVPIERPKRRPFDEVVHRGHW